MFKSIKKLIFNKKSEPNSVKKLSSKPVTNSHCEHINHYLIVPYSEKDTAKDLGAKWSLDKKHWYVEYYTDLEEFKKWRPKLDLEMVPSTCWKSNIRTILTPNQWKQVSLAVRQKHNFKCQFCNISLEQSRIHCHEEWTYEDKSKIQKLKRFVCICDTCHSVKHMGKAVVDGKAQKALDQFRKVNNLKNQITDDYVSHHFKVWKVRSSFQWDLDLSVMKSLGFKKLFYKAHERPVTSLQNDDPNAEELTIPRLPPYSSQSYARSASEAR